MSTNEQHTPLTDEQLQAMRADMEFCKSIATTYEMGMLYRMTDRHIPALLAEVERLKAENQQQDINLFDWDMRLRALEQENAAMRDIVRQVAKGPTMLGIATMYLCNYCDVYVGGIFGRTDHRAGCPVTKARALLASDEVTL